MTEAQIFTLRVWRQQSGFCADLRSVGAERAEHFSEPAALAEFLRHCTEPAAAPLPDHHPEKDPS